MVDVTRKLLMRGRHIRIKLVHAVTRAGFKDEYYLILVSILVGLATGYFAHLFYRLIEWAGEAAFGEHGVGGLYDGRTWMLVLLLTLVRLHGLPWGLLLPISAARLLKN